MSTEVVLTGTGFPRPHPHRAGPGVLVRRGDVALQFDVGRATTMRLAALGLPVTDLTATFLTHHHSDHVVGLTDLLLSRWVLGVHAVSPPLPLVLPQGPATELVGGLLDAWKGDIAVRIEHVGGGEPVLQLQEFVASDVPAVVWGAAEVVVRSVLVDHDPVVPAVAFRVDTPDGAVVVSGDTRPCDGIRSIAQGADVLVHEVYLDDARRRGGPSPIWDYHTSAVELGALAAEVAVSTLVLTHLIPAPDDDALRQAYVDEVRRGGYEGEVVVGEDLVRIALPLSGKLPPANR